MPLKKTKGEPNIEKSNDSIHLDLEENELEETYDWTFINFANKKLEFLIRYEGNDIA